MFELLGNIGGIWFLLFTIAIVGGGIIAAEFDSVVGAVITYVIMIAGFTFVFDLPFEVGLFSGLFMTVIGVVVYVGIGLVYGVQYRYGGWLKDQATNMKMDYADYEKDATAMGETPSKDGFRASRKYDAYRPKHNLDRITAWIALWPWALFWDLCHKPARWIYNTVYDIAARGLDAVNKRISDKILGD